MKKLALCVGINDYPGSSNDLSGCVNDANDWTNFLRRKGYETVTLLDEQATKSNVVECLTDFMLKTKSGDRVVFPYSGHGSWVPDQDGDEPDMRDECLVLYDWENNGFLLDDELHTLWELRLPGVRVTSFSDSCFSGTVQRFMLSGASRKMKFFDPTMLTPGLDTRAFPRKRNAGSRAGAVLLSGCAENEVSYDIRDESGRPCGAMSNTALRVYRDGDSMTRWHKEIREYLPSPAYPQSPQLQATGWQRYWKL